MTRALGIWLALGAAVVVGFFLAHLLAMFGPRAVAWLDRVREGRWLAELRRRGLYATWRDSRQKRRTQQREYVRSIADAVATRAHAPRAVRRKSMHQLALELRAKAREAQKQIQEARR